MATETRVLVRSDLSNVLLLSGLYEYCCCPTVKIQPQKSRILGPYHSSSTSSALAMTQPISLTAVPIKAVLLSKLIPLQSIAVSD